MAHRFLADVAASRIFIATFTALAALSYLGCDRPPAPTREWAPTDHDRQDENEKLAVGAQASRSPRRDGGAADDNVLGETIWREQCASCHGLQGRGDGPNGALLHATNLANEAWQNDVSDDRITQAIKEGKGRMPKFDLPEKALVAVIKTVRSFRSSSASP